MAMETGLAAKELLDKGDVEGARSKAADALSTLKAQSGSVEGVSMIAVVFTGASIALGTMEESLKTTEEMQGVFAKANNVVGEASMLLATAELNDALGASSDKVAALKMANKEKEAAQTSGNKKLEAELLQVIAHAHETMEETYGAYEAAKKASEIYTALGDMNSLGEMQLTMAKAKRLGDISEATKLAEAAAKSFRQAKSKGGQDKALALISALFVDRGQPEKAPTRSEALKCLTSLSKATEMRKVDEVRELEEQLNKFGTVLSDQDLAGVLQPLFTKDPEAMEFLEKELSWDFGGAGKGGGPGEQIKFYPQKAFYLNTIMGGMGFGPQFRSVNPHRVGRGNAISASQLPETEAWQMELGFRPGAWDSGLQNLSAVAFP